MRGMVGSGLTPGTRPDGRTPEIPDPDPENPEKQENPFPARFALLRPNQGTYGHARAGFFFAIVQANGVNGFTDN